MTRMSTSRTISSPKTSSVDPNFGLRERWGSIRPPSIVAPRRDDGPRHSRHRRLARAPFAVSSARLSASSRRHATMARRSPPARVRPRRYFLASLAPEVHNVQGAQRIDPDASHARGRRFKTCRAHKVSRPP